MNKTVLHKCVYKNLYILLRIIYLLLLLFAIFILLYKRTITFGKIDQIFNFIYCSVIIEGTK